MIALWIRRLWPYAVLAALLAGAFALAQSCSGGGGDVELQAAHRTTAVKEVAARAADTVFVHDTVPLARARAAYREQRDTVLRHLTDTVLVKRTIAAADNALELDSTAIASAARAIRAHVVLEGALRTELAIANRLRPSRYSVSSYTGVDVTSGALATGLEATARVTEHWSAVGRLDKRWVAGEPTHRLLLARYTF